MPLGCGSYGAIFASLTVGDEVSIRAGAGSPRQEVDTTDIIFDVGGMSALTARGVRLMCTDGFRVRPTGQHFEPGTYEVSPEAQAILEEDEAAIKQWTEKEG